MPSTARSYPFMGMITWLLSVSSISLWRLGKQSSCQALVISASPTHWLALSEAPSQFFEWIREYYVHAIIKEKAMAPHSSALAWKIPWTEEPGGLQSMGSLRVGHDWATSLSLFTFMHWRRKWQPAPVFLPGESQGWGSLVGCHLWGCTESDTTEAT